MSAPDFAQLMHPDFGPPLQWWHYTDTFAVAGFINRNKTRITKQAIRNGAHCYWHDPMGPLPIYGAQLLTERPDAPVLVLETERAADAARALFPSHVCVTWPGGSTAVDKADTMPFAGRDVVLWPDNDGESWTAMNRLQVRLRGLPRTLVQIAMPTTWPDKWDLTWPPPAGTTIETLQQMLRAVTPEMPPQPASQASIASLPPEGEGGAQRRMGDAEADSIFVSRTESDRTSPIRPFGAPSPSGGREPDDDWPEPDRTLLAARRDDVPSFPVQVLPGLWRPWAEHAARGAGAAVDHVALSLLTTAASLIGTARRVAPTPSWAEPCILWTALVGPPSCGKTAAMDTSLDLLRALDDEAAMDDDNQRRRHITALETARAEHWWWREEVRTAVANKRAPSPIPAAAVEPPPFAPRQLVAEDPTVDAVVDRLCASARGVLLPRDADDSWLDAMARGGKGGADLALWRSAWSGTRCSVSRKRKPAIRLDRPAVSILGAIAPQAIATAMARGDGGIVARFLFAGAQRPPLRALDDTVGPNAQPALARLRDMPDIRRDVPLDRDARAAFDDFRRAHEADVGDLDGLAAQWWAKGPGTVLRLAGVLTFLAWAARPDDATEPAQVPAWAIRAAAALWWDYLWPHADALFRRAGNSEQQRQVGRVLRWLAAQRLRDVSREQIRREALAQAVNADGADDIAATLVDGGWLRPVDHQPTGRPGRPPRRWHVNPALWEETPPQRSWGGAPKGRRGGDVVSESDAPRALPLRPSATSPTAWGRDDVSAISATESERTGEAVIPSEARTLSEPAHCPSLDKIPRCARDDGGPSHAISAISATDSGGRRGDDMVSESNAPRVLPLRPSATSPTLLVGEG